MFMTEVLLRAGCFFNPWDHEALTVRLGFTGSITQSTIEKIQKATTVDERKQILQENLQYIPSSKMQNQFNK